MSHEFTEDQLADIQDVIDEAGQEDIALGVDDFKLIDGEPTVDGMEPRQWLQAVTMGD